MESSISWTIAAALCGTCVLSCFATAVPRVFGFIPAHTFSVHSYPWNMFTYIVVEPNILLCMCEAIYMLTLGAAVESTVGSRNFLQLVIASASCTSVALLFLSSLLYKVGLTWFLQCFCGIWPVASAILVPWVAVAPRSPVSHSRLPRYIQRQRVPTILIFAALVIDWIFRGRDNITGDDAGGLRVFPGSVFTPTLIGICTAWGLQYTSTTCVPVSPSVLFEPLTSLCTAVTGLPRSQTRVECPGDGEAGTVCGTVAVPVLPGVATAALLPGSTEEDAERRRNIALKALNMRLQQAAVPAAPAEAERKVAV
uniref:Putative rhomboid-like protein n=1 Tax=Trypanosoma congolense (strain IL3000) TaxID=1068625 RepID=G0URE3_TRYCI|nr:putative rhomboid-like protein [Trypanosoma congolense IL3000]